MALLQSCLGNGFRDLCDEELINLMDCLRSKTGPHKPWSELIRTYRIAASDKKTFSDNMEKSCIRAVLDILQKSIKINSLQSMVERLDSITRQQGLKFTKKYSSDKECCNGSDLECYISSDMFYVEISLKPTGEVIDVKIADDDPVSSPQLTKVLRSGNFAEFTKHLEGLSAIYQLNADNFRQLDNEAQKKQKKKAYLALQSLEMDLSMLAQLQSSINDPSNLVHKSPVGILQQREGGFSLKLTYFISPYDLLDLEKKSLIPLTADTVVKKSLGKSVTVCIEGSSPHKLQTVSLISVSKTPEGKNIPSFAALSNLNSTTLPASFVLKLPEPVPVATSILRKIHGVTKISDGIDLCNAQSLLFVIIKSSSNGKLQSSNTSELCVTLPDQQHCYNLQSSGDLQGMLISSIPFTHPTHVPQILVFLRQQTLFNTIISSCVRPESMKNSECAFKFDVHAYSTNHIQITFVHPIDESLAAVDLDLKDITNVKCKIFTLGTDVSLCSDQYASKVMQRSLSIPVTMRAVIRKAQGQQQQFRPPDGHEIYTAAMGNGDSNVSYLSRIPSNYNNNLMNGSFSSNEFSNLASRICHKSTDRASEVTPNKIIGNENSSDQSKVSSTIPEKKVIGQTETCGYESSSKNKNLGSDSHVSRAHNQNIQSKNSNLMLMSMLSDIGSAKPAGDSLPFTVRNGENVVKDQMQRKRKRENEYCVLSSPKHRCTEELKEVKNEFSTPDPNNHDFIQKDYPCKDFLIKNEKNIYTPTSQNTEDYLYHSSEKNSNCEINQSNEGKNLKLVESLPLESNVNLSKVDPKDITSEKKKNFVNKNDETGISVGKPMQRIESASPQKCQTSEKCTKKVKKSKDDSFQKHDRTQSVKSTSELPETDSKLQSSHRDISESVGTNLKISKSSAGHKFSKSDSKVKQKDGSGSVDADRKSAHLSKSISESKKDRKRKRTESSGHKSPNHSFQSNPSTSTPDLNNEMTRPDTTYSLSKSLSVNTQEISNPSLSKNLVQPKKNPVISSSKSHSIKSNLDKVKMKSPVSGCGVENNKTVREHKGEHIVSKVSSIKVQNKCKQMSNTKSSSNKTSGLNINSNVNKKAILKLKSGNLPPGVALKSKVVSSSCSQVSLGSSETTSLLDNTDQNVSTSNKNASSGKNNKTVLQSYKGNILSAVIDKLHSNKTQCSTNATEKDDGQCGTEGASNKKEMKTDRKDQPKIGDGKNKFNSSDQFTVKQSSQGIKLTVTKTKSKDGTVKSSKFKMIHSKTIATDSVSEKLMPSQPNSSSKAILTTSKTHSSLPNVNSSNKLGYCVSVHAKPVLNSIHKSPSSSSNVTKTKSIIHHASKNTKVSLPHNKSQLMRKKVFSHSKGHNAHQDNSKNKIQTVHEKKENPVESNVSMNKKYPENICTESVNELQCNTKSGQVSSTDCKVFKVVLEKVDAKEKNEPQHMSLATDTLHNSVAKSINVSATKSSDKSIDINKEGWATSTTDSQVAVTHSVEPSEMDSECKNKMIESGISSSSINNIILDPCLGVSAKDLQNSLSCISDANRMSRNEDASSPDGLIIDYSEHSKVQDSEKWVNSHFELNLNLHHNENNSKTDLFTNKISCQPSPPKSPEVLSPHSNHSSSSLSRPSPAVIDDELMNEAVMTVGK